MTLALKIPRDTISTSQDEAQKRFLTDTLDLFRGKRSGHMITYAYSEPLHENDPAGGAQYWPSVTKSEKYYPFKDECEVVKAFASSARALLPKNPHFIELGCGDSDAILNKTVPFIQENSNGESTVSGYAAVDINAQFVEEAGKIVSQNTILPSEKVAFSVNDFMQDALKFDFPHPLVFLIFGGFLCNIASNGIKPIDQLEKGFQTLKKNIAINDYLVVTQDSNQDSTSLLEAYDDKIVGKFVLSTLHRIKRDLDVSEEFDPYAFKPHVEWDDKNKAVNVKVKALQSMGFTLNGEEILIKKGQKFSLSNSFKFSVATFIAAAERAGYASRTHLTPNSRTSMHVLQRIQ